MQSDQARSTKRPGAGLGRSDNFPSYRIITGSQCTDPENLLYIPNISIKTILS